MAALPAQGAGLLLPYTMATEVRLHLLFRDIGTFRAVDGEEPHGAVLMGAKLSLQHRLPGEPGHASFLDGSGGWM